MLKSSALLLVAAALACGGASARDIKAHDGDIVWPTYVLVSKSYDSGLSCPKLNSEIGNVERDIRMLIKARLMAEQSLRQANDTQSSMGRDQGGFLNTGTSKVSLSYLEAREQIKESQRVAELRRDHLIELRPSCKQP